MAHLLPPRKFRDYKKRQEEEDIVKGKLPAGFAGQGINVAVSHAAAVGILKHRQQMAENGLAPEVPRDKEVVDKCWRYLESFSGLDDPVKANAKANEVKTTFPELGLTDFEISQMINLRPSNVEEARTLIMSFERFDSQVDLESLSKVLQIISPELRNT